MKSKKKTIFLILASIATLTLAVIAVVTAIRLRDVGGEPIAPTAPVPVPAVNTEACSATFTVSPLVCNSDCSQDNWCAAGLECYQGKCRNPVCPTQSDCTCPEEKHLECVNEACVEINGGGDDQCTLGGDECLSAQHLECVNEACVEIDGAGLDLCADDVDCETPTHLVCVDEACVEIDGAGGNECDQDTDCETPQHLECVNEACVAVLGGGQNLCTDNTDCEPDEHLECVNQTCVTVTGEGSNECSNNSQCVTPTHLECQSNACVTVSGAGANLCDTSSDCVLPSNTPVVETEPDLPEAGISLPTTAMLSAGLVTILLGLIALLL